MSYGDWKGLEGHANSQRGITPEDKTFTKHEDRMSWVWGISALTLIIAGGMAGQWVVIFIGLGLLYKAISM